jgi:hypothetical protein
MVQITSGLTPQYPQRTLPQFGQKKADMAEVAIGNYSDTFGDNPEIKKIVEEITLKAQDDANQADSQANLSLQTLGTFFAEGLRDALANNPILKKLVPEEQRYIIEDLANAAESKPDLLFEVNDKHDIKNDVLSENLKKTLAASYPEAHEMLINDLAKLFAENQKLMTAYQSFLKSVATPFSDEDAKRMEAFGYSPNDDKAAAYQAAFGKFDPDIVSELETLIYQLDPAQGEQAKESSKNPKRFLLH